MRSDIFTRRHYKLPPVPTPLNISLGLASNSSKIDHSKMRLTAAFVPLLSLTACTPASAEPPLYGLGQAKDGDSLMVGDKEVRVQLR